MFDGHVTVMGGFDVVHQRVLKAAGQVSGKTTMAQLNPSGAVSTAFGTRSWTRATASGVICRSSNRPTRNLEFQAGRG